MACTRRRHPHQAGAAAVEFALITIFFLTMVFAVLQYSLYFWSAQTGSSVTRETLRRVSLGYCLPQGDLENYVNTRLGGAKTANATVTRTFYQANGVTVIASPGVVDGIVRLNVTFPTVNLNIPFVPFLSDSTVTHSEFARVENTEPFSTSGGCTP